MSKLTTATPPLTLVDAYLAEIARAYRVPWAPVDASSARDDTDATDEVPVSLAVGRII